MPELPAIGTPVEIQDIDRDPSNYSTAVVVDQPEGYFAPNDTETWVWVQYDYTNDICPVREYHVRTLAVSTECLAFECGNCWDDTCACPLCDHL